MLPWHVSYFILFPLPAIALYVAEEVVVLITPCPSSAFNHERMQGVSDVGAGKTAACNEKQGSFRAVDVSSHKC